jgi:hypothetical protein
MGFCFMTAHVFSGPFICGKMERWERGEVRGKRGIGDWGEN